MHILCQSSPRRGRRGNRLIQWFTMVGAETSCWPMKDQQRLARLTTRPPCDCWEGARIRFVRCGSCHCQVWYTISSKHHSLVRSRRPAVPNRTCPMVVWCQRRCFRCSWYLNEPLQRVWPTLEYWDLHRHRYKPCRCFDSQADMRLERESNGSNRRRCHVQSKVRFLMVGCFRKMSRYESILQVTRSIINQYGNSFIMLIGWILLGKIFGIGH